MSTFDDKYLSMLASTQNIRLSTVSMVNPFGHTTPVVISLRRFNPSMLADSILDTPQSVQYNILVKKEKR